MPVLMGCGDVGGEKDVLAELLDLFNFTGKLRGECLLQRLHRVIRRDSDNDYERAHTWLFPVE
jgi:hypothetical protein